METKSLFKSEYEFLEYLYTDYICGTDSLDFETCKNIVKDIPNTNLHLIAKKLKTTILHKIIDFGIPLEKCLEFDEKFYIEYCKYMFHINFRKLPKLTANTLVEVNLEGKIFIGRTYQSEFDVKEIENQQANRINLLTLDCEISSIIYPNVGIFEIKEINNYSTIKLD